MPLLTPDQDAERRLHEALARALGLIAFQALNNPDVTEIYVNPSGGLFLDTRSRGRVETGSVLSSDQILRFLNQVASVHSTILTTASPQLQAELPRSFQGARLQGLVPPVTSAPVFNIRKPAATVYSLDDYVATGALSPSHRTALGSAVADRKNVLIVGGTGSGKTTFANALLHEMTIRHPLHRIVILEDTVELQCSARDHVAMRTTSTLKLRDLVKAALRISPDRIVVGEVRDEAALDLCDAWETGHPGGSATLHAEDPLGALHRLDRLAQRCNMGPQADLVAAAIDIIAVITGGNRGRRITQLVEVCGYDGRQFTVSPLG